MLQYELFRQSMIGWAALGSFLLLGFPSIRIESGSLQWLAAIVFALASSPAFGYVIGQLNRVYYTLRKNRPNDVSVNAKHLHAEFSRVVTPSEPALLTLKVLAPKDLNRFLWVTYANKDLRDRSESYWERYYTNVCIVLAAGAGSAAGIANFIRWEATNRASQGGGIVDWVWLCVRFSLLVAASAGLLRARKDYHRIACAIENAWIDSFLEQLRQDPSRFSVKMFNL